jgi:hypothetical protein
MITQTCSLQFTDGQVVTAQVVANTGIEDASVSYSGPVERLPFNPLTANAVELRAYFKSFARELRAGLTEDAKDDRAVLAQDVDELLNELKGLGAKQRKVKV